MEQRVAFESNCIPVLTEILEEIKPQRILLVTGKNSFEKSGAKDFILGCLSAKNANITRFSDFDNNPNIKDLKKGLEAVKIFDPDLVIAAGGGSVIDMGKLIRFFHTPEYEDDIFSGKYSQSGSKVPLIAIPTTAGTGSEATHFAVLYDEKKTKHSIANPDILPEYAIVNSDLTLGQSPYLTACAGFDALAQGIEAYWNKNATEESDRYAEKAIELVYETLPKVVSDPNDELRAKMSEGAYWAGRAINITKTTAPHAFSYPFTTHYGIPHGHAVALTFPYIADYNFSKGNIPEYKKDKLTKLLNTNDNICLSLKKYINQIEMYTPVMDYDIELISREINLERLANNPADLNNADAIDIIRKSLSL